MKGYLSFLLVISFLATSLNFVHSYIYLKTPSMKEALIMEKGYQKALEYKALTKAYARYATIAATYYFAIKTAEEIMKDPAVEAACASVETGIGVVICAAQILRHIDLDKLKDYVKKGVALSFGGVYIKAFADFQEDKAIKIVPWCGDMKGWIEAVQRGGKAKNYHPFPKPPNAITGFGDPTKMMICSDSVDVDVEIIDTEGLEKSLQNLAKEGTKNLDLFPVLANFLKITVKMKNGGGGFGYLAFNPDIHYARMYFYPGEETIEVATDDLMLGEEAKEFILLPIEGAVENGGND